MRSTANGMLLLVGVALMWILSGCAGNDQPTTPPPAATGMSTPTGAGAALGTAQAAGPFQVTLSTQPAAPRSGDTRFQAKVTKGGQPVTDATVNLSLSMPSMNMAGPEASLQHMDGGSYEGTANLSMGGDWEAKTSVAGGGDTGTAVHRFTASQ